MQDDLRKIFDGFEPRLSSDTDFMCRLECNLERFRTVRESNEAFRRRQRRAAAFAAVAGFVAGIIFTYIMPSLAGLLARTDWTLAAGILSDSTLSLLAASAVVAGASMFAACNTYEISLAAMERSCRVRE